MNIPEIFIKIGEYLINKEVFNFRLINKNIKKYLEKHFNNLSFSNRMYVYNWYVPEENFISFSKNSGIRLKKIIFSYNRYITKYIMKYLNELEFICLNKDITEMSFITLLYYIPNIKIITFKCCWRDNYSYEIDRLNKKIIFKQSSCNCSNFYRCEHLLEDIFIKTTWNNMLK